jgi:hypothetical protein
VNQNSRCISGYFVVVPYGYRLQAAVTSTQKTIIGKKRPFIEG